MKEMHTYTESQKLEHKVPDKIIWVRTEGRGNMVRYRLSRRNIRIMQTWASYRISKGDIQ